VGSVQALMRPPPTPPRVTRMGLLRGRRGPGKVRRAIEDVATWDPLDLTEDPYDRKNVWSSDAPGAPGDLRRYAEGRGLAWTRDAQLWTFNCIHAWGEGVNLNTCRGALRDGTYGLLGHQLRDHKVQGTADDGAGASSGAVVARIREGHTLVATLVPETRTTLVAATAYAAQLGCDGHGVTLEPLDNDRGWRREIHPSGDRALFDAVLGTSAAERLRPTYPWGSPGRMTRRAAPGGKLDVRAGIASVWAPGFLEDPAELDGLVDLALAFADELHGLCAPRVSTAPFGEPLPAPSGWTDRGKAHDTLGRSLEKAPTKRVRRGLAPRDDVLGAGRREDERWAGLRDFAAGYAHKRRLELEDGDAFGDAFPGVPYTGWAQFAARGELRAGTPYRIALTAQRPFLWQPAFAAGGAVAVAPVPPGTPDEPVRPDSATGCLHAVTQGLRSVVTYDAITALGHDHLDLVAAELERALG
jgi:hypothetical protein